MSSKGQKNKSPRKSIQIKNQKLYGAESGDESESPKPTTRSVSSKEQKPKKRSESKKFVAAKNELCESVTDYFKLFLEEHKVLGTDINDLAEIWKSDETQNRLKNIVKMHMPEPEVSKPRKKKDPNEPKRNKTAYIFFGMEMRDKIKQENPGIVMTQVSVKLGEMWKSFPANKKKKFEKMAEQDKSRYVDEMRVYKPDAKMFKQGPKRNLTAYFHFCAEKRQEVKDEHPDLKTVDIARELGRMWREDFADENSRQSWVKQAADDKIRYEQEKKLWLEEHPEEVKIPTKKRSKTDALASLPIVVQEEIYKQQVNTTKEKTPKKKSRTISNTEPSGMILFMKQARAEIQDENPQWDTKQIVAEMKKRWSAMSPEERSAY